MSLPNDSIAVTPGAGNLMAAHLIGTKKYQLVMLADVNGHVLGSHDIYVASALAMAKAASKNYLSVFNADATLIMEIIGVKLVQEVTAAVTGLVRGMRLFRITSVHSAGTLLTPEKFDPNSPNLDPDITARSNGQTATPVGAALSGAGVWEDEAAGGVNEWLFRETEMGSPAPIVCRQNSGVLIQQDATAGVGVLSTFIFFRVR